MNRKLTTESGSQVADNQNSQTAGAEGPVLLQDQHLIEKLARFNRERIPERIVHARGSGAFGHFEVTNDVTPWTRASFLSEIGKKTESLDFAGPLVIATMMMLFAKGSKSDPTPWIVSGVAALILFEAGSPNYLILILSVVIGVIAAIVRRQLKHD